MSRLPLASLVAVLLLAACQDKKVAATPPPAAPPARAPSSEGPLREKLGFRFLPMPGAAGGESREWIAAMPVRCSPGEHEGNRCPAASPLATDPRANPGDGGVASAMLLVTNAETAHRACAQRFGGRLPMMTERAKLRASLGLVSVLVVETRDPAERFRYLELPEWTEEGQCSNPVRPGEDCRVTVFPPEAAADALLSSELACTAQRVGSAEGRSVVDIGDACPRESGVRADGGVEELPCLLRVPGPTPADAPLLYALRCRAAVEAPRPTPVFGERAGAFRCVLAPIAFGAAASGD